MKYLIILFAFFFLSSSSNDNDSGTSFFQVKINGNLKTFNFIEKTVSELDTGEGEIVEHVVIRAKDREETVEDLSYFHFHFQRGI